MGGRRKSRELALKVLYQMEHGTGGAQEALDSFAEHFQAPEELFGYARQLVEGWDQHRDQIDGLLDSASRRWPLERMSQVDRNILRLATFEILYGGRDVPSKVAINEAVELAKRYGGDDSPRFINALLDAIRNQQKGAGGAAA